MASRFHSGFLATFQVAAIHEMLYRAQAAVLSQRGARCRGTVSREWHSDRSDCNRSPQITERSRRGIVRAASMSTSTSNSITVLALASFCIACGDRAGGTPAHDAGVTFKKPADPTPSSRDAVAAAIANNGDCQNI